MNPAAQNNHETSKNNDVNGNDPNYFTFIFSNFIVVIYHLSTVRTVRTVRTVIVKETVFVAQFT